MNILIVVATYQEIEPFIKATGIKNIEDLSFTKSENHIKIIVTGVGMVATAFALGKELAVNSYDLAINAGIAGSFTKRISIGELVQVTNDVLSELGAEDDEEFLSLEDMQMGEVSFSASDDPRFVTKLKKVNAITVNKVHGNAESIEEIKERLEPQIESMEGAAFFYACEEANIPAMQVRAISNYVETRNRENWNIPLAVKNLNAWLSTYLS